MIKRSSDARLNTQVTSFEYGMARNLMIVSMRLDISSESRQEENCLTEHSDYYL